jgi:hypothetical protein
MANYGNGKIYTIRSFQTEDIYIGSTTQPLSKRIAKHRYDYNHYLEGKRAYTTSFDILKHGDAYIELIELYPCTARCELFKREGELIREMDCVNKHIPGRTDAEYYQDNKEKWKNELVKVKCDDCGAMVCKVVLPRHKKTKACGISYKMPRVDCKCGATISNESVNRHKKTKKCKFYHEVLNFILS